MNIVQLHNRVRFWIDSVSSTRFDSDDIDLAINITIPEIVDEKYDHSQLNHRSDSFEKTQRIRDELSNLVVPLNTDGSLSLTNNVGHVLVNDFPDDYKYLLAISLYVGTKMYNAWPLTHDRKNIIQSNPFRRVRETPNVKCYFIQDSIGLTVYHPFEQAEPTMVDISYLADPAKVFYGYEKGPSDGIGLNTDFITTLTPTSYKSTEYVSGTELTTDAIVYYIDYGLAVINFENPDINGFLHEEIARRAAMNCLLTSGEIEKYKILSVEVLAT